MTRPTHSSKLLNASRRQFLRTASVVSGSVGAAAVPFALNLTALSAAVAQATGDYKAIVCLFMYGGNDASNMVLRTDDASFAEYTRLRSVAPESIALKAPGTTPNLAAPVGSPDRFGGVLPLVPKFTVSTENKAFTYAVHPNMPEVPGLFAASRLAVVANVGPLVEPLTRAEFLANVKPRPQALFSHNDQQSTWQALGPEGAKVGWGGHLGDLVASGNSNTLFTSISVSGTAVFSAGDTVFQYQVGTNGAVPISSLSGNLFGSSTAAAALKNIVTASNQHLFANEYAAIVKRSSESQAAFQAAYVLSKVPDPSQYTELLVGAVQGNPTRLAVNPLAVQLQTVARIIGARAGLGTKRQVFFVSLGGFDTHDGQNIKQADLLARVSHALAYFDGALAGLPGGDMRNNVTLFTASDFGRTFTSNGDGTDHGWGSHHFVMGGAVKGGEIYGRFPQFGQTTQDSAGNAYLPAISVDSLGATLGKWFGASDTQLDTIFPNLRNFNRNLGFLA
jgi:uncharacterized protein (DUF1501 family)